LLFSLALKRFAPLNPYLGRLRRGRVKKKRREGEGRIQSDNGSISSFCFLFSGKGGRKRGKRGKRGRNMYPCARSRTFLHYSFPLNLQKTGKKGGGGRKIIGAPASKLPYADRLDEAYHKRKKEKRKKGGGREGGQAKLSSF